MVLRKSGRVGRRRSLEKDISFAGILFCVVGGRHRAGLLPPLRVAPLRGLPLRVASLRGLPGLKSWVTINADFVRPVGADK